jgi:succinate dehydrogenase / fumarate reductase flavoprotein subunit
VSIEDPVFRTVEAEVSERVRGLLAATGTHSVDHFHRELGRIMWEHCGMSRNGAGLKQAIAEIAALREQYHADVRVLGDDVSLNQSLEKAGRVSDFFELAELMCRDALEREESCGCHFRVEHQTPDHEALRNDDDFSYVAAWEYPGVLHKEPLAFQYVHPTQRSYK